MFKVSLQIKYYMYFYNIIWIASWTEIRNVVKQLDLRAKCISYLHEFINFSLTISGVYVNGVLDWDIERRFRDSWKLNMSSVENFQIFKM